MTGPREDLYWKWAEASGYAYSSGSGPRWFVQILVEFKADIQKPAKALHTFLRSRHEGFVPKAYRSSARQSRYCTAWVARNAIQGLPGELVERFKLGIAVETANLIEYEKATNASWAMHTRAEALVRERRIVSNSVVLAVIDDRVQLGHPEFFDERGQSRICLYWDQTSNFTAGTRRRTNFGYTLLRQGLPQAVLADKRRAYHGTHVASLAGGRTPPSHRMRHSSPGLFASSPALDAASDVPLAVVMLPNLTVEDTSGGALGVNVLDALVFLLQNVSDTTKLVVNLSFGHMAGPHNGTSILECAMQELVTELQGRLQIVVPAGNAFESRGHASFDLTAGPPTTLTWRVLPDDRTPSFLELWLPSDADVEVTLTNPLDAKVAENIGRDSSAIWPDASGATAAGVWRSDAPANGNGMQMVLLALAPTRSDKGKPVVPHGDWTVTINNLATGQAIERMHAWVERDGASFGRQIRGRQSYLVDAGQPRRRDWPQNTESTSTPVTGYGSLNAIATGNAATVVGSYTIKTGAVAAYSGAGTNDGDVRCPDGLAPGDESPLLRGIPGASNEAGGRIRLAGTSVAAPLISRFFVNELCAGKDIQRPAPGARQTPSNGYDKRSGMGKWLP